MTVVVRPDNWRSLYRGIILVKVRLTRADLWIIESFPRPREGIDPGFNALQRRAVFGQDDEEVVFKFHTGPRPLLCESHGRFCSEVQCGHDGKHETRSVETRRDELKGMDIVESTQRTISCKNVSRALGILRSSGRGNHYAGVLRPEVARSHRGSGRH